MKNITNYEVYIQTDTDFMREFLEKSFEVAILSLQQYLEKTGKKKSKIESIKNIIK